MKEFLLLLVLLTMVFMVGCTNDDDDDDDSEEDDDDTSDDDDDGDDDDDDDDTGADDDDLASCDYEYEEYPGWFEIPDLYWVALDLEDTFGQGISADCQALLDGKNLTVDCGLCEFSAKWVAEEGNFPLEDGQEVRAYGSVIDGSMGYADVWIFDSDRNPLFFHTNGRLGGFELDGNINYVDLHTISLCAFSLNDPSFYRPTNGGAYWTSITALGAAGYIYDSNFELTVQGEPIESQDGKYLLQVLNGYLGIYDAPDENIYDGIVREYNVQAIVSQ